MATRYTSKFTDDLGGEWGVEIMDADYVGSSPFEFTLGADGFTLDYESEPQNRFQPVIGSTVQFSILAQNSNDEWIVEQLAASEEGRFSVKITRDPDGSPSLFWSGVILAEQVTIEDAYFPRSIRLTASDDIGNLTNVPYNDNGTAYTGKDYIYRHLLKALKKVRHIDNYGTTAALLKWANNFHEASATTSADHLADVALLHSAWYNLDGGEIDSYASCFEVIENIARAFNARFFQHEGAFCFIPAQLYVDFTTSSNSLTLESCRFDGTKLTQATLATKYTSETDGYRRIGNALTYMRPLQRVQKTWDTAGAVQALEFIQFLNPISTGVVFPQQGFAATSDATLSYATGQQIAIYTETWYRWATGVGFAVPFLRLTIQCGSLYYTNTITWTSGPGGHAESVGSWGASAGYFYIALTPTWHNLADDLGEGYIVKNYTRVTADLPSDQEGLTITPAIVGWSNYGATSVANFSSASAFARVRCRAYVVAENDSAPQSVIHQAVFDGATALTVDEQTLRIGSSGYTGTRGQMIDGAPASDITAYQDFKTLVDGTITATDILTLGCREILSGQKKPVTMRRGDFYGDFIGFINWVLVGSDGYLPTSVSFTANDCTTSVEMYQITADNTDITTPTAVGQFGDDTFTNFGGASEMDTSKLVDLSEQDEADIDTSTAFSMFING